MGKFQSITVLKFLMGLFLVFQGLPRWAFSQTMTGEWKGLLVQEDGGFTTNYKLKLEIHQLGNRIEGKSLIIVSDQPKYYSQMEFTGEVTPSGFHFRERRILEQNIPSGWYWCLKEGDLLLDTTGKDWKLTGVWEGTADFSECSPGKVSLSRPGSGPPKPAALQAAQASGPALPKADTVKNRTVQTQETVSLASRTVDVYIWDADAIDGDSVSISLNGKWVLQNYRLAGIKKKLTIELKPGQTNQLVLFALNVGRIPPNTAAVSVFDGKNWHSLRLKSDLSLSGALDLVVSP